MCHKKEVPDEWQVRNIGIQVSSCKHNAKKNTTRVRGPFHQSITNILTKKEKQLPTHVAVYLFWDQDQDGVDSKDDSGYQGQYREQKRVVRRKMTPTVKFSEMNAKNVEHFKITTTSHIRTYRGRVGKQRKIADTPAC